MGMKVRMGEKRVNEGGGEVEGEEMWEGDGG